VRHLVTVDQTEMSSTCCSHSGCKKFAMTFMICVEGCIITIFSNNENPQDSSFIPIQFSFFKFSTFFLSIKIKTALFLTKYMVKYVQIFLTHAVKKIIHQHKIKTLPTREEFKIAFIFVSLQLVSQLTRRFA
jgi:hypothetical protein